MRFAINLFHFNSNLRIMYHYFVNIIISALMRFILLLVYLSVFVAACSCKLPQRMLLVNNRLVQTPVLLIHITKRVWNKIYFKGYPLHARWKWNANTKKLIRKVEFWWLNKTLKTVLWRTGETERSKQEEPDESRLSGEVTHSRSCCQQ